MAIWEINKSIIHFWKVLISYFSFTIIVSKSMSLKVFIFFKTWKYILKLEKALARLFSAGKISDDWRKKSQPVSLQLLNLLPPKSD